MYMYLCTKNISKMLLKKHRLRKKMQFNVEKYVQKKKLFNL